MTKTRNKLKIMGLLLALVMMVSLIGMFGLTVSADSETVSGSWGDVADVSFMNGQAGTEEDPYEISTAEQLAGLAALVNESNNFSGKHIKLTADIDLSAHSWVPIGIDTNLPEGASAVFSGSFDGAGHTVSGMTIGTSSMPEDRYQNAGLFGYVSGGKIKNLTVSGSVNLSCPSVKARVGGLVGYLYVGEVINCHSQVNVTVSQNTSGAPCYVGGVVGYGSPAVSNHDTNITGCTNSGTVTVTCTCSEIPACYVGGVAGYIENTNAPFISCFNSGSVKGGQYTGGVVGYATNDHEIYRNMEIYNCANVGSVTGDGHAGGILGGADSSLSIHNCYHAGDVSGAYAGGIVGDANHAGGATFCYWLSTSAEAASGDGEGHFDDCSALSEAQMKAAAGTTDESWEKISFTKAPIALVDALNAYAKENTIHGVACAQWHICSAEGASVYPTYYESFSYNDFNGLCNACDVYQPAERNESGYYEIANAGQLYWFAQQINGGNGAMNGKLIANIVVNQNVLNADGTLNGDGSNFRAWTPIGYSNSYEDRVHYVGTFDGAGFTVSGLYFNDTTANYVGLFGYVGEGGKVMNVGMIDSYINGGNGVGSVASDNRGTAENCYNTGSVSGTSLVGGVVGINSGDVTNCHNEGSVEGSMDVGGVVGGNSGTVENCYNTGSVNGNQVVGWVGTNSSAGGVVGGNVGSVKKCYNEGSVIGVDCVGGVVGINSGDVTNCHNEGSVSGNENVGGLVGSNDDTVTNCYNIGTVSGGFYVDYVIGLNNGDLMNCYYLLDTAEDLGTPGIPMTTEEFASGAVAYFLGEAFGQTLGENGDAYPVFVTETNRVYRYTKCDGSDVAYTNDSSLENKVAPHTPRENAACTDNKDGTHSFTCAVCDEPVTAAHDFDGNELECGVCHASAVSIYGQQLNIGSDLSMKYYVEVLNSALDVEKLKMTFTINDAVIEAYDGAFNADGFYVFTLEGINPQCMGDSIYAKLYYNGIEAADHGYDEKYSVEINLNKLLVEFHDDAELVTLIKDTLAYGEAASAYMDHQTMSGTSYTENGSNREIPEASVTLEAPFSGYTVRFGVENYLKIGVVLIDGNRLYLNGVEITDQVAEDGTYTTTGLAPTDFATKHIFEVRESDGATLVKALTLDVNDYTFVISQSEAVSAEMKALARALYNYGYSATVYDHVVNGAGEHVTVNGICTLCNENVGYDLDETTQTYSVYEAEALQTALNEAALDEGTVKLMRDLALDAGTYYSLLIRPGKVILDLNGYSLTSADEVAILVAEGATLTVRDSDHTGSIDAMTTGLKTTGIKNQGELSVESGIIRANTFGIYNDGILTISGGTVGAKEHVAILGGEVNLIGAPVLANGSVTTGVGCDIACSVILVQGDLGDARYTYYDSEVSGNGASQYFAEFTGYSLNTDRTCFEKVN